MMHSRYRRARTPPEVCDARPLSLQVIFTSKSAPEVQLPSIPQCPPALSTVACAPSRAPSHRSVEAVDQDAGAVDAEMMAGLPELLQRLLGYNRSLFGGVSRTSSQDYLRKHYA